MANKIFSCLFALLFLLVSSGFAQAEVVESVSGAKVEEILRAGDDSMAPVPAAPPVINAVPVSPVEVTPAQTQTATQPAAPVAPDQCEAYKYSTDAYIICQDRLKKIQTMIDAQAQRQERYATPAPTSAPAAAPAAAAPVADTKEKEAAPATTTPASASTSDKK